MMIINTLIELSADQAMLSIFCFKHKSDADNPESLQHYFNRSKGWPRLCYKQVKQFYLYNLKTIPAKFKSNIRDDLDFLTKIPKTLVTYECLVNLDNICLRGRAHFERNSKAKRISELAMRQFVLKSINLSTPRENNSEAKRQDYFSGIWSQQKARKN